MAVSVQLAWIAVAQASDRRIRFPSETLGSKRESSGLATAEAKGGGWARRASGALARKQEQPEPAWRCLIFKLWGGEEEGVEGAH